MKFKEIQKVARDLGLKCVGVKKPDLVRSIQQAEGNVQCFSTGRGDCDQYECCWWEECMGCPAVSGKCPPCRKEASQ